LTAPRYDAEPVDGDVEELDALPVLSEARLVAHRAAGEMVVRQAAAVAVTSFAAGLATVALGRVVRVRRARRRRLGPVVASRSFVVDVHLLGPR
jgi:hypothetical protein